jgi:hypothetical protein
VDSLFKQAKSDALKFVQKRYNGSRRDQFVDVLWDASFEGLELASKRFIFGFLFVVAPNAGFEPEIYTYLKVFFSTYCRVYRN